jgi:hypothetical protein
MYHRTEGRSFTYTHCWMKLKVQHVWDHMICWKTCWTSNLGYCCTCILCMDDLWYFLSKLWWISASLHEYRPLSRHPTSNACGQHWIALSAPLVLFFRTCFLLFRPFFWLFGFLIFHLSLLTFRQKIKFLREKTHFFHPREARICFRERHGRTSRK